MQSNRTLHFVTFLWLFIVSLLTTSTDASFLPAPIPRKPIPGDSPVMLCDVTQPQLLQIHDITLDPNPPLRDHELTIDASGILNGPVETGSYVDIEVRLGYIKLLTQRFDLCQLLNDESQSDNDMVCPVSTGEHHLVKTVKIPKEVPGGKYTFIARAYTNDGILLTCLTGDFIFPANF